MMHVRSSFVLALAAFAFACGGSPAPDTTPRNKANKVEVTIASVTLADDCGTGPTTMPSEPTASLGDSASMDEPSGGASMSASMARRACEQSSIQLRVANSTDAGSKVAIEKVEVLDESGAVVGELTPRDPSKWDADAYAAWDEQVAPSQVLQVSYALSAPLVERGATYTVRVTLAAGDDQRTLEQKTTLEAEASLPPGAVT
jgi:hypothetical protein